MNDNLIPDHKEKPQITELFQEDLIGELERKGHGRLINSLWPNHTNERINFLRRKIYILNEVDLNTAKTVESNLSKERMIADFNNICPQLEKQFFMFLDSKKEKNA